jgi:DNA repair exonuclease SbcCD nuclease subunit
VDTAQRRGLSYLAIGDTHAFRELPPKANPTVYPGAPEATKFGEFDAGFVAVVFFPAMASRLSFKSNRSAAGVGVTSASRA